MMRGCVLCHGLPGFTRLSRVMSEDEDGGDDQDFMSGDVSELRERALAAVQSREAAQEAREAREEKTGQAASDRVAMAPEAAAN